MIVEVPRLAAIVGNVKPTIGPDQNVICILRIDNHRMEINMHDLRSTSAESLAAIVRDKEDPTGQIDALIVFGIDANSGKVK